jgi:hypothetical protein
LAAGPKRGGGGCAASGALPCMVVSHVQALCLQASAFKHDRDRETAPSSASCCRRFGGGWDETYQSAAPARASEGRVRRQQAGDCRPATMRTRPGQGSQLGPLPRPLGH